MGNVRDCLVCLNVAFPFLPMTQSSPQFAARPRANGHVAEPMFSDYHIDYITNGVRAGAWVSPSLRARFDTQCVMRPHIWRASSRDNVKLLEMHDG
jgi:hypothetical protein